MCQEQKKKKNSKKIRFVYLVFIIEVFVVEKNMYLSRFQHLAGDAMLLWFQNLADKFTFQYKDKSRVFLPPLPTPFLILFFLPLWQSYITIWDLSAALMHYSIIKWHSHYRLDDEPLLKALWIKQLCMMGNWVVQRILKY